MKARYDELDDHRCAGVGPKIHRERTNKARTEERPDLMLLTRGTGWQR